MWPNVGAAYARMILAQIAIYILIIDGLEPLIAEHPGIDGNDSDIGISEIADATVINFSRLAEEKAEPALRACKAVTFAPGAFQQTVITSFLAIERLWEKPNVDVLSVLANHQALLESLLSLVGARVLRGEDRKSTRLNS